MMRILNRQKLDVVNRTRSKPALPDRGGKFRPEFTERGLPEAAIMR
jgi:hypothetical protein